MTSGISNFQQPHTHQGPEHIFFGNGAALPIANTAQGLLPTPSSAGKLSLQNIFHVPNLSHNLLSINQLTLDNNCIISFDSYGYIIKDISTNQTLLQGPSRNGLYPISITKQHQHAALLTSSTNNILWHNRLGHPHMHIQSAISNSNNSLSIPSSTLFCTPCKIAKSHKLPFSNSTKHSYKYFDLIHSDVWEPSPVLSIEGYKYYISFIDDSSRFIWVFPLHCKYETTTKFIEFTLMVQTQYNTNIKILRSDGGGEYNNHHLQ